MLWTREWKNSSSEKGKGAGSLKMVVSVLVVIEEADSFMMALVLTSAVGDMVICQQREEVRLGV